MLYPPKKNGNGNGNGSSISQPNGVPAGKPSTQTCNKVGGGHCERCAGGERDFFLLEGMAWTDRGGWRKPTSLEMFFFSNKNWSLEISSPQIFLGTDPSKSLAKRWVNDKKSPLTSLTIWVGQLPCRLLRLRGEWQDIPILGP